MAINILISIIMRPCPPCHTHAEDPVFKWTGICVEYTKQCKFATTGGSYAPLDSRWMSPIEQSAPHARLNSGNCLRRRCSFLEHLSSTRPRPHLPRTTLTASIPSSPLPARTDRYMFITRRHTAGSPLPHHTKMLVMPFTTLASGEATRWEGRARKVAHLSRGQREFDCWSQKSEQKKPKKGQADPDLEHSSHVHGVIQRVGRLMW
jgi:hypothetical protein